MFDWSDYGVESGSQVTDQMIVNVEARLSVSFPQSYIDLIKYSDEAIFEVGVFEYEGGTTCISEFLKFTDTEEQFSILWYQEPSRIVLPENLIAIARDSGDYLICLDFNSSNPSVKLFNPNERLILSVADNFEEFISILEE